MQLFPEVAAAFRQELQQGMTGQLMARLLSEGSTAALRDSLFEYFASFALKRFSNHETFKTYR